jgi:hypothetical protein
MHKIKNKGTNVVAKRPGDLLLRAEAPRRAAPPVLRLVVAAAAVVLFRVGFAISFEFGETTDFGEFSEFLNSTGSVNFQSARSTIFSKSPKSARKALSRFRRPK